ncbi:hypothetical protein [Blastococcus sp. CCUG 61487]|uniref:hypothetical protein n=1 Tax=Blastococcus sp. CCUG 61487 TaxID=1840703 RepID=UPI0010C04692|nr:hypothetical protein [Blastococcus sp. CCUG 61487]TKJ22393.1 hypothetical protein A6V29_06450 [Blastococcus sp. CCUG 61487]
MDLEQVADELYEVPPEQFIALRKQRQDEAKADGDKALAKEIGGLGKPSAAAWACNLLVRAHRDEIVDLVELGRLLREAQENLAGDQLRALDVQRRQLVSALARQARGLAAEQGHPVSTAVATQVEETLRAAMADPEAGQALLTGRLTSPMSYSGLGTTVSRPDLRLVHPPRGPTRPAKAAAPRAKAAGKKAAGESAAGESAADRRAREQEERRRAGEEKRRRELAEARAAADQATAAATEAAEVLDEVRQRVDELGARRAELQERVEALADQLADAEREAADAAAALKREERRRAAAEREAADAAEVRDRAVARLDALAEG